MTIDDVIASSTAIVVTAGTDWLKTILGVLPTFLEFAIPIGLVVGAVMYFLHRRKLGRA